MKKIDIHAHFFPRVTQAEASRLQIGALLKTSEWLDDDQRARICAGNASSFFGVDA